MAKKRVDVAGSGSARTTAQAFRNPAPEPEKVVQQAAAPNAEVVPELPDDPASYKFPLNLIFEFQDFCNKHMTMGKGVEVMVVLYTTQIFYFYLSKDEDLGTLYAVGFNLLGLFLSLYLSHKSLKRKQEKVPGLPEPRLPDFNTVYAVAIPTFFSLVLGLQKAPLFQLTLALNNLAAPRLPVFARVVLTLVFYYMYNEQEKVDLYRFAAVLWLYFACEDMLQRLARRLMSCAEVHLVSYFAVALLMAPLDAALPLNVGKLLLMALIPSFSAAYVAHQAGRFYSVPALSYAAVLGFPPLYYLCANYVFGFVKMDPVPWLHAFIFASETRVRIVAAWLALLGVSILVVFFLALKNQLSLNSRRKVWHFLLSACIVYPTVVDPVLTTLALVGALLIFFLVEALRSSRATVLGAFLADKLAMFEDAKDKGPLSLSYVYLVLGMAVPYVYSALVDDYVSIRTFIGVAVVGVGDAVALIVGHKWGRTKWRGLSRTIEGSVAFFVSTFAAFVAIDRFVLPETSRVQNWENLFIVVVLTTLLEGAATLNDNVLLPCMGVICYEVLELVFDGQAV